MWGSHPRRSGGIGFCYSILKERGGGMVSSHKMALARLDDSHSRRGLPVTTPVAPHH